MNNLLPILPIIVVALVFVIGQTIVQRWGRKPLPKVPSGRIIRATFTIEEKKRAGEWM